MSSYKFDLANYLIALWCAWDAMLVLTGSSNVRPEARKDQNADWVCLRRGPASVALRSHQTKG